MPVGAVSQGLSSTSRTGNGSGPGAQREIVCDSARFPGPELSVGVPPPVGGIAVSDAQAALARLARPRPRA